jgi:hypothetical protein
VRSAFYIAIVCSVLVFSGCGRSGKITMAPEGSQPMQDAKYAASLSGPDVATSFGDFLQSCPPEERAKYIRSSTTDYTAFLTFRLKAVYEKYSNDANADVAEAAKEALTKVPTAEEADRIMKEQMEKAKDPG